MTPEQKPSIAPQLVKRYERYLTALGRVQRCDLDLNTKAAKLGEGGCVPDELLRIKRIKRALEERTLRVLVFSKAEIEANIFRSLSCSDQEKISETLTFENKRFLPKGSVENVLLNLAKKSLPDQQVQGEGVVPEKLYNATDITVILGLKVYDYGKKRRRMAPYTGKIRRAARELSIRAADCRRPHYSLEETRLIIDKLNQRHNNLSKDEITANMLKLEKVSIHSIYFNGRKILLPSLTKHQLKMVDVLAGTSKENPISAYALAKAVYKEDGGILLRKKNERKITVAICLLRKRLKRYGLLLITQRISKKNITSDSDLGDRVAYYLLEKNVFDKIAEAEALQLRQESNEGLRQFCMADIAKLSGFKVYSYKSGRQTSCTGFIRKIALQLGIDEARERLPKFTQEEAEKIKEEVRKVQAAGRPGRTHNRGEEAPLAASTVPVIAPTGVILERRRGRPGIRNGMPAAHVEKETDSRPSWFTDEDVFVLMQGLIEMSEKGLLPVGVNLKDIKSDEVRHVMGRVGISLYPGSDSPYSESNLEKLKGKINMFKNDKEKFLKGCSDVSRSLLSFFDDELKIKILFDAIEGLKKPVRYVSQVS